MNSRIEQIIEELEDYIASCRTVAFSGTKISVDRDTIYEFIEELKLKTPDEIKRYQKLISNRDAIIAEAKAKADAMLTDARMQTEELINEHEIMQRAYEQANAFIDDARAQAQAIVDSATEDANNIRIGAIHYTDEMLANLQMVIEHSLEDSKSKYEALMNALQKDLTIVSSNRKDLTTEPEQAQAEEELAAGVKEALEAENDYEEEEE